MERERKGAEDSTYEAEQEESGRSSLLVWREAINLSKCEKPYELLKY